MSNGRKLYRCADATMVLYVYAASADDAEEIANFEAPEEYPDWYDTREGWATETPRDLNVIRADNWCDREPLTDNGGDEWHDRKPIGTCSEIFTAAKEKTEKAQYEAEQKALAEKLQMKMFAEDEGAK